jgi:hypothetical protein
VLRDLLGLSLERVQFVVNQPTQYGRPRVEDLADGLSGTPRILTVPFGGEEVSKASLNGLPLVMSRSGNPVSRAIVGLARELDRADRERVALSRCPSKS